jgi:hypothetical protein
VLFLLAVVKTKTQIKKNDTKTKYLFIPYLSRLIGVLILVYKCQHDKIYFLHHLFILKKMEKFFVQYANRIL